MMHNLVEVYAGDMFVKLKSQEGHAPTLRKWSKRL